MSTRYIPETSRAGVILRVYCCVVFKFRGNVSVDPFTTAFGTNLTIEEEKVEFPKGRDAIKAYTVSPSVPYSNTIIPAPFVDITTCI